MRTDAGDDASLDARGRMAREESANAVVVVHARI